MVGRLRTDPLEESEDERRAGMRWGASMFARLLRVEDVGTDNIVDV